MAIEDLTAGLNDQFNREVTTFLRYMRQAASIKGIEWNAVREMYLEEVTDEVDHAQYLANQIAMLGSAPKLNPDLSVPPSDVKEMLLRDAEEERKDVKKYMDLASLAESEGLFALKLQLEEQAADEDRHGQKMVRLLG